MVIVVITGTRERSRSSTPANKSCPARKCREQCSPQHLGFGAHALAQASCCTRRTALFVTGTLASDLRPATPTSGRHLRVIEHLEDLPPAILGRLAHHRIGPTHHRLDRRFAVPAVRLARGGCACVLAGRRCVLGCVAGSCATASADSSKIAIKMATIECRRNLIMFSLSSLRPALLREELPHSLTFPFPDRHFPRAPQPSGSPSQTSTPVLKCSKRGIVTREGRVLLESPYISGVPFGPCRVRHYRLAAVSRRHQRPCPTRVALLQERS